MFVVIVNHWCKPDKVDIARGRIDFNGDEMMKAEGFVSRYRLETPSEPGKVSTVTVWTDRALYEKFKDAQRKAAAAAAPTESPYERVVNETFEVMKEHRR